MAFRAQPVEPVDREGQGAQLTERHGDGGPHSAPPSTPPPVTSWSGCRSGADDDQGMTTDPDVAAPPAPTALTSTWVLPADWADQSVVTVPLHRPPPLWSAWHVIVVPDWLQTCQSPV